MVPDPNQRKIIEANKVASEEFPRQLVNKQFLMPSLFFVDISAIQIYKLETGDEIILAPELAYILFEAKCDLTNELNTSYLGPKIPASQMIKLAKYSNEIIRKVVPPNVPQIIPPNVPQIIPPNVPQYIPHITQYIPHIILFRQIFRSYPI
ncbi:5006_t:CDS:2 [Acaulospora morrowiae]|uniref:5006_t:CDS:1 n=1 Tax=Acaulospora morrowiae TaxID=94023 RepID=A0A9N9N8H8_9GLOM|nr:5006_t:CDS:2 [Acaulospora morrowiae]